MTVEGRISRYLAQCGLWPDEVTSVMPILISRMQTSSSNWYEDASNYSEDVLIPLKHAACAAAISWIDGNKPKHYAREILQQELNPMYKLEKRKHVC